MLSAFVCIWPHCPEAIRWECKDTAPGKKQACLTCKGREKGSSRSAAGLRHKGDKQTCHSFVFNLAADIRALPTKAEHNGTALKTMPQIAWPKVAIAVWFKLAGDIRAIPALARRLNHNGTSTPTQGRGNQKWANSNSQFGALPTSNFRQQGGQGQKSHQKKRDMGSGFMLRRQAQVKV